MTDTHRHVAYTCIGCGVIRSRCDCFQADGLLWPCGRCQDCRHAVRDPMAHVDGVSERIGRSHPPDGLPIQETVWNAIWPDGSHLVDLEIRANMPRSRVFSALQSMMERGIVRRVRHGVYQHAVEGYQPPRIRRGR